jgi:cbb3-type cytochrome oxidase subunit 3
MEKLILIILLLFVIYYLFRPTSKEELKRFKDNDNWSNMGF